MLSPFTFSNLQLLRSFSQENPSVSEDFVLNKFNWNEN